MSFGLRGGARGRWLAVTFVSLFGCPSGEMAPPGDGSAGADDTGTGDGSTGAGTGDTEATVGNDDEGSGGGTMGYSPIVVECGDFPPLAEGAEFVHVPVVYGGDGIYTWSASGLPGGLGIDQYDGEIDGAPEAQGDYDIVLTVTDGSDGMGEVTCSVTVASPLQTATPDGPLAEDACISGDRTINDVIVDGTGDGSPITCTVEAGGGNGRVPDGISVNPDTCAIEGTVETDRFGVYAFMVRGEQSGVSVYAPYCVTQNDDANTYTVDADHSGAMGVPQTPLVGFFDPTGTTTIGGSGDPHYSAIDATVCEGSNSCYFGFLYQINSSPFDADTFDIIDDGLVIDVDDNRIGLEHGLTVTASDIAEAFQDRPWIQNVTMTYCLSVSNSDCVGSTAITENAGAQLEISILMFPQSG